MDFFVLIFLYNTADKTKCLKLNTFDKVSIIPVELC